LRRGNGEKFEKREDFERKSSPPLRKPDDPQRGTPYAQEEGDVPPHEGEFLLSIQKKGGGDDFVNLGRGRIFILPFGRKERKARWFFRRKRLMKRKGRGREEGRKLIPLGRKKKGAPMPGSSQKRRVAGMKKGKKESVLADRKGPASST